MWCPLPHFCFVKWWIALRLITLLSMVPFHFIQFILPFCWPLSIPLLGRVTAGHNFWHFALYMGRIVHNIYSYLSFTVGWTFYWLWVGSHLDIIEVRLLHFAWAILHILYVYSLYPRLFQRLDIKMNVVCAIMYCSFLYYVSFWIISLFWFLFFFFVI